MIDKAEEYVARAVSAERPAYTLAVAAYVLAAVNNPQASLALQTLDLHANVTGQSFYRAYTNNNQNLYKY